MNLLQMLQKLGRFLPKGLASHVPVQNTKQTNVMSMRMYEVYSTKSQLLSMSHINKKQKEEQQITN